MKCQACQKWLVELFHDEIPAVNREKAEAHLADCASCKIAFDELNAVLGVMTKRTRPEPAPEFLDSLWANIEHKLDAPSVVRIPFFEKLKNTFLMSFPRRRESRSRAKSLDSRLRGNDIAKQSPKSLDSRWSLSPQRQGRNDVAKQRLKKPSRFLAPLPNYTLKIAGAVALFAIGVAVGKLFFSNAEDAGDVFVSRRSARDLAFETALDQRSQAYFEKSKIILLGMVNFDAREDDPYLLNLPFNQQLSTDLVREAAVLRDDLTLSGRNRLSQLVQDLEIVLLQIANLEKEVDLPAIELIQNTAQDTGVLLKINLEQMRRDMSDQKKAESNDQSSPSGKEL